MQDDRNGAFEAVEHLVANGYQKIAHISGPRSCGLADDREQGYRDALRQYNLPIREEWIVRSGFSQEDGERDACKLLACEERPDAIFAVNDRKAIGAMLCLKKNHIQIGSEMGVIGFTNDPVSDIISPGLTTVAEPAFEVGTKAAELLIQHIIKKNLPAREIVLPGSLVVRESTVRSVGAVC